MEIKTQVTYIAKDGNEFEYERDCINHEELIDSQELIEMYDENFNLLAGNDWEYKWGACFYVYIPKEIRIYELNSYIYWEHGIKTPEKPGWWYFEDEQWKPHTELTNRVRQFEKIINRKICNSCKHFYTDCICGSCIYNNDKEDFYDRKVEI